MTREYRHGTSSRVVGGLLAWILFVVAPFSHVVSQQEVSEVDDGDIVLPTVVLELDEPASGGLEVALPIDIQILAPERWPPLPEAGELDIDLRTAVAAPAIEFAPAVNGIPGRTLVAEAFVSAGTRPDVSYGLPLALFASGVSVLGTGPDGNFSLAFTHSLSDGIRKHRSPGQGAKSQRHELAGSVSVELAGGEFAAEASMVTAEHGFGFLPKDASSTVPWDSADSQAVAGAASYLVPLGDQLQLTAALDAGADATTLTGNSPESYSEVWAAPDLSVGWSAYPLDLQFSGRYLLRRFAFGDTASKPRHSANVGVAGRIDLAGQTGLELSLGWSWSSDLADRGDIEEKYAGHRFVPQATISGTPTSWFTYRLSGGFEVRELGLAAVAERSPYLQPRPLRDDDGWFASGRAQFGLGSFAGLAELTLVASTRVTTHSAALSPIEPNRDATKLYDLEQQEVALSIVPGLGLGLGFGDTLQIRANVSGEAIRKARIPFAPLVQAELEVAARTADGGLGIRVNTTMDYVSVSKEKYWQLPEVEIEGLWQQGATTVTLTLTDVLELVGDPREDWPPYQRPGFGASVAVHLAL